MSVAPQARLHDLKIVRAARKAIQPSRLWATASKTGVCQSTRGASATPAQTASPSRTEGWITLKILSTQVEMGIVIPGGSKRGIKSVERTPANPAEQHQRQTNGGLPDGIFDSHLRFPAPQESRGKEQLTPVQGY